MTDAAVMTAGEVLASRTAEVLDVHPDAAVAALEKCKPWAHLRVIVQPGDGLVVGGITVRFIAQLMCRNPKEGPSPTWGALLDPGGKQIGMHLFPDAVAGLAHQLPIVADEARAAGYQNAGVALQHTVAKGFSTWRLFVPDEADAIAAALAVLHG
jgi:hypothetical protein